MRRPLYVAPGHFYSPLTSPDDVQRARAWRDLPVVGIEMHEPEQLELVRSMALRPPAGPRWAPNSQYGPLDAAFLVGVLEQNLVNRVVEVGSGYSTAAMLDFADHGGHPLDITCIDPFTDRLRSRLQPGDAARLGIHSEAVQDVDLETFMGLREGDVLLIDSTHVAKAGSDVLFLVLHVLPRLRPGVLVHVHDIHWPFEYPDEWLDEGRDWTEVYLLRAVVTDSSAWQIVLLSDWVARTHPEVLPPELRTCPTGQLWIRRV
jgi:predicted O-methyltransferase YrrM